MSTRLHYGRKFQLWIMSTACVTFHSSWENSLLMALQPMRLQISIKFKPGIMVCLAALQPLLSHCILWISYDTSTPGWKCLFERPLPMKVCVYVRFGHPSFKCKTPHNGYALKIKAVELWHAFDNPLLTVTTSRRCSKVLPCPLPACPCHLCTHALA